MTDHFVFQARIGTTWPSLYVTANSCYFYEKNIKKAKKIRFDQLNGDGNYRKFVMMSGKFYIEQGGR